MEMLITAIVNAMIGPVANAVTSWHKTDVDASISRQQIEADLRKIMTNAALEAYRSGTDAAFKMFDSFQQSLRVSDEIRRVWKVAVYSQLAFIVFLEMGVPALVQMGYITSWKVGSLDTWALGFLGASLGISPIVLKPPKAPGGT